MAKSKILTGNIYGFFPSINTFQGISGKLDELWSGVIKDFQVTSTSTITFWFVCVGYKYVVNLKKINETNYQGKALCEGEESAKVYYTLYKNTKGYALIGTWTEDDYNYDSLIEVRF